MQRSISVVLSVLLVASVCALSAEPIAAGTGSCASNNFNYFSSACYYKDTQFSGAYTEWTSVSMNITQTAANNGEWIAEHLIMRDRQSGGTASTFLEVGDTAGGAGIPGHNNEWARMWYWVDGSSGYSENFIQYAPGGGNGDNITRGWGMQWETSPSACAQNAWVIYVGGSCKAVVTTWKNPTNTADFKQFTGMEIYNGGRTLDASKNSGLYDNKNQQWRDLNNAWHTWDLVWTQNDAPCGTAPTCLQGWWNGIWNNGKPSQ